MKTVGSYKFVVDTWIEQKQGSAHTPRASGRAGPWGRRFGHEGPRMFFEGATIYSYGHHFPLACLLEHNGKRVALVNPERYSVTTSKHQSLIRSRLAHAEIPAYEVFPEHGIFKPNPLHLLNVFKSEFESAKRSRDRLAWVGLNSLKYDRLAYLTFCREFGFEVEFDLSKEDWKVLAQRVKIYYDRRQVKQFAKKLLHGKEIYG